MNKGKYLLVLAMKRLPQITIGDVLLRSVVCLLLLGISLMSVPTQGLAEYEDEFEYDDGDGSATPRTVKWTMIMILAGNYDTMQSKLEMVGASADVNIVVLHDPYGYDNSFAYRMNIGPGPAVPIPLMDIFGYPGPEIDIASRYVLDAFLSYVQTNFPAQHYLLSLRGNMDFYSFIEDRDDGLRTEKFDEAERSEDRYDGITIVNFEWVMDRFVDRNAGRKVDVLHFGLCLSAVIDWMYEMADYADYFVSTEYTSNPPVAAYWRNYRYAWELNTNPDMTASQLAIRIVQIFMSHAYTGYYPDEPATASAVDLTQIAGITTSFRTLMSRLVTLMPTQQANILRAIAETEYFGYYRRLDIRHFMERLKHYVSDTQVQNAATAVINGVTSAVIQERHEHFRDVYGMMIPVLDYTRWHSDVGANYLARYGDFAENTDFDDFMNALPAPTAPISGLVITEVNPFPNVQDGTGGDRIEIYNKTNNPIDLRGLIIDDLDSPRMYALVDASDINQTSAILQAHEFAVIRLRRASANPYTLPTKAEVIEQSYGLDIISYTATQRTILSDHDDQVVLLDRDNVVDAIAWHNASGSSSGIEAVNLETLVGKAAWIAPENIAQNYFSASYTGTNTYESATVNFSYIAGSESGSIQRNYNGYYFDEGALGADSPSNFCVSRNTNLGTFTPVGQGFTPRTTPLLLLTEIAPNISNSATTGDMVEIYNRGLTSVDLYDIVLSDMDPGEHEEDLCGEEMHLVTDAIGPGSVILHSGKMAVVQTISGAAARPDPEIKDYGWLIKINAGDQFENRGDQVVLLNRDGGDLIDSVVYTNNELSGFSSDSAKMDFVLDVDGLTQTNGGFGFVVDGGNAWTGADSQVGNTLDQAFTNYVNVSVRFAYGEGGGGSLQRRLVDDMFSEGNPDSRGNFVSQQQTSFGELPGVPPTMIPTPTPTGGPTITPTATPSGAASPTPAGIECTIETNAPSYRPGDLFILFALILNQGPSALVDEYILLDVYGEYWFWPSWSQEVNFRTRLLDAYDQLEEDILTFVWPSGAGSADNIFFHIGLLESGTVNLHCIHSTSFRFYE